MFSANGINNGLLVDVFNGINKFEKQKMFF